jgi:hypothetical protein
VADGWDVWGELLGPPVELSSQGQLQQLLDRAAAGQAELTEDAVERLAAKANVGAATGLLIGRVGACGSRAAGASRGSAIGLPAEAEQSPHLVRLMCAHQPNSHRPVRA